MIKVGFDISQLAHGGGVATYTQNLAKQLSKIQELEVVYFYSSLRKPYNGDLRNVKEYKIPPTLFEILFNRLRNVNIERFLGQIDIFHSSDWIQPPTKALKVTTYHDLVPLKYPNWSDPKIVEVQKRRLKIVEKEIDMVITVSEATKKDLLEISDIPEEKITVIYEAAGDNFKTHTTDQIEEFRKKYNLPKSFVLAVGGVGTRRNLETVKKATKNYNLVISGITIPWLCGDEMSLLYSSATVLLYPSFYEGFGLPILEAFKSGTPVITSNLSSMPEIGGLAAVYVDPNDLAEIISKLDKVITDGRLREKMIKAGLKRAELFSWEKCAQQTADIYKSLYEK